MAGLEHLPPTQPSLERLPRASLLLAPHEHALLRSGVWIGGAHSDHGEALAVDRFASAWVLDLAGDMPAHYRERASRWQSFVIPDVEAVPPRFERFQAIVREFAAALRSPASPADVFVMCQYGYNRSGLAAGLLLRELGLGAHEALALIRERRPGALANSTFSELILGPA